MAAKNASAFFRNAVITVIAVLAFLLAGAAHAKNTRSPVNTHIDIASELGMEIPESSRAQWQEAAGKHAYWLLQVCSW